MTPAGLPWIGLRELLFFTKRLHYDLKVCGFEISRDLEGKVALMKDELELHYEK